jgi:uncharacterized lipoprotein YajG
MKVHINRIVLLLASILFLTGCSAGGISKTVKSNPQVKFNDNNLKKAIEETLSVSNPTALDMLSLYELNAKDKQICDLTGLEYAKNMIVLRLNNN